MDPYAEWLQIPRHERPGVHAPPHHYVLLGVELFTANYTLINAQADRRMRTVKAHEQGPHVKESQKLLKELALARKVLLDPELKGKYDSELRQALGLPAESGTEPQDIPLAKAVVAQSDPLFAEPGEDDFPGPLPQKRKKKSSQTRPAARQENAGSSRLPLVIGGSAVAVLLLAGITWGVIATFSGESTPASPPEVAASDPLQDENPIHPIAVTTVTPVTHSVVQPVNGLAATPAAPSPTNADALARTDTDPELMPAILPRAATVVPPVDRVVPQEPLVPFSEVQKPTQELTVIPLVKTSISESEFSKFTSSMQSEREGRRGYQRLQAFQKSHEFNTSQQERLDALLEKWREPSEQDLLQLNGKWLSRSDAEQNLAGADQNITEAIRLMQSGSESDAERLLESVTRTDAKNLQAQFLLGLIYSVPTNRAKYDPADAQTKFDLVIRGQAGHLEVLNSLGICRAKAGQYAAAINFFEKAGELSDASAVVHNLKKLLALPQSPKLKLKDEERRRITAAIGRLQSEGKVRRQYADSGWLHVYPELTEAPGPAVVETASGSHWGFAVTADVLVTQRRSVYTDQFGIQPQVQITKVASGDDPETTWDGQPVYFADADDLAFVHVPGLAATPLPIARQLPPLGSAATTVLGAEASALELLPGTVWQHPETQRDAVPYSALFRFEQSQREWNGAVLDPQGRLVTLLSGAFIDANQATGYGVTGEVIRSHLEKLAEAAGQPLEQPALESPELLELDSLKNSVFRLTGAEVNDMAGSAGMKRGDVYSDRTCFDCRGRTYVDCPDCHNGSNTVRVATQGVRADGNVIQGQSTSQVRCGTCDGSGKLPCHCDRGVD